MLRNCKELAYGLLVGGDRAGDDIRSHVISAELGQHHPLVLGRANFTLAVDGGLVEAGHILFSEVHARAGVPETLVGILSQNNFFVNTFWHLI